MKQNGGIEIVFKAVRDSSVVLYLQTGPDIAATAAAAEHAEARAGRNPAGIQECTGHRVDGHQTDQ